MHHMTSSLYPPVPTDGQPGLVHHPPNGAVAVNGTPKPSKAVPNAAAGPAAGSTPGPSAATPGAAASPRSVPMTPQTAPASLKRKAPGAGSAADAVSPTTSTHEAPKRPPRKRNRTQTSS